jgi:hypothetical protein
MNLVFSAVLLVVGLSIYWFWRPPTFQDHRFTERAFEFWILKWMLFCVTFGLLSRGTDLRFVLASVDLTSVMGIGFAIALWKGDSYDERHTFMNLLFLFGLLFSWNFVSCPLSTSNSPNPWIYPMVWIMPSMTVALLAVFAMGAVIVARHGKIAITFLVVSIAYLVLQMPTYQTLFVTKGNPDPELLTWLAFGKVLYGATFYPIFFSPITNFAAIQFPSFPGLGERTSKLVNWALLAIAGGLLSEAALSLGKLLLRKITGHVI